MKRKMKWMIILCIVFSVCAGCGGKKSAESEKQTTVTETEASESERQTDTETETKTLTENAEGYEEATLDDLELLDD